MRILRNVIRSKMMTFGSKAVLCKTSSRKDSKANYWPTNIEIRLELPGVAPVKKTVWVKCSSDNSNAAQPHGRDIRRPPTCIGPRYFLPSTCSLPSLLAVWCFFSPLSSSTLFHALLVLLSVLFDINSIH